MTLSKALLIPALLMSSMATAHPDAEVSSDSYHRCSEQAFTALCIALEQPLNVLKWTAGHFFLNPEAIVYKYSNLFIYHNSIEPYLKQGQEFIRLWHVHYRDMKPYLRVNFEEFWQEAKAHLSEESLENPPPNLVYVLRLYTRGCYAESDFASR